ncbi:hypothetical protein QMK19_33890 [Streptomyces sp. H10-C2]|uniref:hypothetical protein n=1 Tax=unclassified Streptomyces TaxID=2593676 RepID=UPI0024B9590E|nr:MULTISPECIES: hypothetical protein [unclassified Streptomyces]MDJ0345540.1 hypothetical protein [Streptomyces sp. PH10-H1]MDJ0374486.1 hypothetical protein [Streptomyces sp. H10-C2]
MIATDRSVYRQIAAELADRADAEAAAQHPHLGRACAELGLVYLALETAPLSNRHVAAAWKAAEDARQSLAYGTAVGCAADTARARLHLALGELDAADLSPTT